MYNYSRDCLQCMRAMNMPGSMYPVAAMPEQQLEAMYPKIYFIINPVIMQQCDMMDMTMGPSHVPNQGQVESMVDDIYDKVQPSVEAALKQEPGSQEERQFGFGGRGLLRGLIAILLLRELLRRRRRPFFGFSPFGGFPGGFGGFNGF